MSVAPWRAALRLAARDDRRARGRTALVVALIGLPVLVLGVVAIGYRTYSLSPGEKLARSIGTADLAVRWSGLTTVSQNYEGWLGDATVSEGEPTHLPSTAQITALMPPGSRVVAKVVTDRPLTVATRSGLALEQFVGLDVGDPLARGIVSITAGRAPRTTGEVAVTPATARADGLHVGDLLRAEDPSRAFRIVGVVASDTD
ncbi:MAG: ABC transporter permease, partial [Jatrophihabitans sp.]